MLDNNRHIYQLICDNVYKLSLGKSRIEWNGGLVFSSLCACSDIYFMNRRAANVVMGIDGQKTIKHVMLALQQIQPELKHGDIVLDIIKTLRFLESVKAVQLKHKGGKQNGKHQDKKRRASNA